jgi:FkbM family methyltransferase
MMNPNKILACWSLGVGLKDKLALALFGLLAPPREWSHRHWWRLHSRLVPKIWVRPGKLSGLRLLIKPTDWSQTVIFEEVFLNEGYDLCKVTFVPDVILDCGAHIGIFSLLARGRFPGAALTAYEPNPKNAWFVRQQIAGNGLDIKLFECAISTENKQLSFEVSNSHNGRILHGRAPAGTYPVQAVDFIEAFKQIKPASLLLKMDIEGEERDILPLLVPLLPNRTALFFETHAGEAGWREIEKLLTAHGFKVEQISARGQFYDGFALRHPGSA